MRISDWSSACALPISMGSLLGAKMFSGARANPGNTLSPEAEMLRRIPHFIPKAKRIVYLFMAGGPSPFETFDYQPKLVNLAGTALPYSVRNGQRPTGTSASQSTPPMVPSINTFQQHGQTGPWGRQPLPTTAQVVGAL